MKRIFLYAVLFCLTSPYALAQTRLNDIRVEGLQRIAWLDRCEKAAVVFKIRNCCSREIDPDWSRDKGAGEGAVQNASTETGLASKGLIHMQRVEIPKQARCRDQMGLSNGEHIIKLIAHTNFIVGFSLWNSHASPPLGDY